MITLITGSNGQLGLTLKSITKKNPSFFYTDKQSLDITKKDKLESFIKKFKISCIINCAAYTDVDQAEIEKQEAYKVNCDAVKNLSDISKNYNLKLIHISTDYVYNGEDNSPLSEETLTDPLNYYGKSKREGEEHILNSDSESIIIRTSWLYSRFGKNFVKNIIKNSKIKSSLDIVGDQFGCPTNALDLASAIITIIDKNIKFDYSSKIYNYSNLGYTTWFNFAKFIINEISHRFDLKLNKIETGKTNQLAVRPKFTVTDKTKIMNTFDLKIPHWEDSLEKFLKKEI